MLIVRMRSRTYWLASLFCLGVLLCSPAFGQSGTSSVRGTVSDAQGKVVPGATVTLVDLDKNTTRTQTTGGSGEYAFVPVTPGYRIDVEAKGFKKGTVTEIVALVDTPTTVPVNLEVGSITEVVTVTASGNDAQINTTDATIGNTFNEHQIKELPLDARNVANLLSLPAVTQTGEVAGGRNDQANITIDGIDANDQQSGTAFTPVLRVTPDSVSEFRVSVSNPNATQGRSSGAQVSLVTKSGTNQFHGSLYEFLRNTALDSNDWFNNSAGVPLAKLDRNVFGGSVGGPILRDKLFFFYNFEGLRLATRRRP